MTPSGVVPVAWVLLWGARWVGGLAGGVPGMLLGWGGLCAAGMTVGRWAARTGARRRHLLGAAALVASPGLVIHLLERAEAASLMGLPTVLGTGWLAALARAGLDLAAVGAAALVTRRLAGAVRGATSAARSSPT